ncbi:MAG TPA: hypothetical protein VKP59_01025 [Candidatus Thermoplasmatota archaeon]|nr:hypothetical protein [Candidatus Thermoplasmatota archaeon]
MITKKCEICERDFDLKNNRRGLVLDDHHFICESCNSELTDDDREHIPVSVMHSEIKEMPIALWLIQEQNRDKPFMSVKKF